MNIHAETFMTLDELGGVIPPFRPSFAYDGDYIDDFHRFLGTCPLKDGLLIQIKTERWWGGMIKGWLRREDALKLYELAYFAEGDILELGSHHGLSTIILAQANRNSPFRKHIYSVDLNSRSVKKTERALCAKGLNGDVTTVCGDATDMVRSFAARGMKFACVFIDHSHAYGPVFDVCRELEAVVVPAGVCLFHDFNDSRNRDVHEQDYGVYQAVTAGLSPSRFGFCGIYGCTALYRLL